MESLGLRPTVFPNQSRVPDDGLTLLANLVAFTLWYGKRRRDRAAIEQVYETRTTEFRQFLAWTAQQKVIPVESSPLHGTSLDLLMRRSSLLTFAVFVEGYGLVHHDPVVCILAPPITIIIGAAVGAGEALQERTKRLLGATKKTQKKRPKKSDLEV